MARDAGSQPSIKAAPLQAHEGHLFGPELGVEFPHLLDPLTCLNQTSRVFRPKSRNVHPGLTVKLSPASPGSVPKLRKPFLAALGLTQREIPG